MTIPPIAQADDEINEFIAILRRAGVRSYLEIGSQFGGSLWRVGHSLPVGSRLVSIDWETPGKGSRVVLEETAHNLRERGYNVALFAGDSTDSRIIAAVKALGPFDAIFIDANHTLEYVTADWTNYGPLGKIVAFHDIAHKRLIPKGRKPIEVPQFWNALKVGKNYREIISNPETAKDNGIGVIFQTETGAE